MFSMSWFLSPMDADVNIMAKNGLSGTILNKIQKLKKFYTPNFIGLGALYDLILDLGEVEIICGVLA